MLYLACYFLLQILRKGKTEKMGEKDYKTGYSTTIKISTKQKIVEYSSELKISQADVGRKIIEYFIEHNDVEDLQN